MNEIQSDRRQLLTATAGLGGLFAIASAAALGQENAEEGARQASTPKKELETFAAPRGKSLTAEAGRAAQIDVASVVSVASHTFQFQLRDGDISEQTAAINRPANAGFIVTLIKLYYAFVNSQGGTQLRERPLGELVADIGMRGNNLVCRARLTDINADDPVSITVTGGVLFFT